jgi:hypothetical protein
MGDRRRAAVWPYLCVLVCLFVVCVTARRSWWRLDHQPSPTSDIVAWLNSLRPDISHSDTPLTGDAAQGTQPERPINTPLQQADTRGPDQDPPAQTSEAHVLTQVSDPHVFARIATEPPQPAIHATGNALDPSIQFPSFLSDASARPETPEGISHNEEPDGNPATPPAGEPDTQRTQPNPLRAAKPDTHAIHPGTRWSDSPELARNSLRRPGNLDTAAMPRVPRPQAAGRVAASKTDAQPQRLPEWNRPTTLLARLDRLITHDVEAIWARQTAQQIHRLTDSVAPSDQEVPSILSDLRAAADAVVELAERWRTPRERTSLLQAQHALVRRLDVWDLVLAARQATVPQTEAVTQDDPDRLARCVAEVASLTDDGSEIGAAWRQYLLLSTLQTLAEPTAQAAPDVRRTVARRVRQRLNQSDLTWDQRRFVEQDPLTALDQQLRFWAAEPIDLRLVLADLERFESTAAPHDSRRVAEAHEALANSPQGEHQALAHSIDAHYRNANFRIAVSGQLINQLIPQPELRKEPVRETIAGADVRGRHQISTQLFVRLVPDPRRIRLGFEARGTIRSRTASSSGPATFFSSGRTAYSARKLIQIGPQGTRVWPAVASADAHTQLLDVETSFDQWPLIGNLVRWIAKSQHDQRLGQAIREVERKVARRVRQQLDTEANARIAQLEEALQSERQAALRRFDLRAVPVDIHTTDRRIVARMRIASPEQLGAHTARPRAPADSQLSLQLHESAIQNLLDELHLDGRRFTLPELYRTVATKLGRPDIPLPDDLPERASVQFADRDAVQVHCVDGRVQVTLAIAELSLGRQRFRGFQAVASYRPAPSGLDPVLVRDGIIHLNGKRFRTRSQIVLRGVFAKLFPRNEPVHLLPQRLATHPSLAGLEIHQFVIDNGWIGLAVAARTTHQGEGENVEIRNPESETRMTSASSLPPRNATAARR